MEPQDYRLAAVMFTDIVGFSRMMEEDEPGTLKTLDFHNKLVREQVERFRGGVIKTIGDAFLAQFSTTLDAVQCSLAVQEGIREYNEAKLGKPLTLRIGVHLGDIYFYENDALGEGINIASRLQSATKPGHITISREVYSQVSGKIAMRVESMGQVHLKNISREVHAYEIIPGGEDNNSSAYRRSHQSAQEAPAAPAEPQAPPSGPGPAPGGPGASGGFGGPGGLGGPGPWGGPRDLRAEWKALRDQVRAEGRPYPSFDGAGGWDRDRWREVKHQLKDQIKDEIRRARREAGDPTVDRGDDEGRDVDARADGLSAFQAYKKKRQRQARSGKGGFLGHLIPFLGVNGLLYFIWITTTPGGYPWFLYPLMGWGIGLISHWAAAKGVRKTSRELEKIDDLGDEDFRELKRYQDARGGFYSHLGSNLAVVAFLEMVGLLNPGAFPWIYIPMVAIGIGIFSHLAGFVGHHASFKEFWRQLKANGLRSGARAPAQAQGPSAPVGAPAPAPDADPVVRKAQALRDSIRAQAEGIKGDHPAVDDLAQGVDTFVLQITELSKIERELGGFVASLRPSDLEAEAVTIRQKIATTTSTTLKQEYEKSLVGLEDQKRAIDGLAEQQEILGLKIKGALGNLQQTQIELARFKGLADGQAEVDFHSLQEKSDELSRYIEDYREGLKEIPG